MLGMITAIALIGVLMALINMDLYPNKSMLAMAVSMVWLSGFLWVNFYRDALKRWADHE